MNDGLAQIGRKNRWGQPLYLQLRPEIDPFENPDLFRPLSQAYGGQQTVETQPSPEPNLPDYFWQEVMADLRNEALTQAATTLAMSIAQWEAQFERLLFISILRAGVPIADWLTRLLPGSQAVTMGLFVGSGVDKVALRAIQADYPNHRLVFVDGWTGRGGVARELAKLQLAPLAVLIDPWGWADFRGCATDLFCPTACFTGPTTLGFSRAFSTTPDNMFSAYLFPERYLRSKLIETWQAVCYHHPNPVVPTKPSFFKPTPLRIHSNEVCRALINANPETIYFVDSYTQVKTPYALLLMLAELRHIPIEFEVLWLQDYDTKVACLLQRSEI